jgi:hypothetical protein
MGFVVLNGHFNYGLIYCNSESKLLRLRILASGKCHWTICVSEKTMSNSAVSPCLILVVKMYKYSPALLGQVKLLSPLFPSYPMDRLQLFFKFLFGHVALAIYFFVVVNMNTFGLLPCPSRLHINFLQTTLIERVSGVRQQCLRPLHSTA